MMNSDGISDASELRQRAEEILKIKPSGITTHYSEADALKLIHELEVYHIEMELQNEELMKAKEQADQTIGKYTELYDVHNRLILHFLKKLKSI